MLTMSVEELDLQLLKYYSKNLGKKTESLRTKVSDSPTQYLATYDFTRLIVRTRRRRHLIGLILMSWYMTDEVRILLHLQLEKINWNEVGFDLGRLLLTSKSYSLGWLLEQEWWNEFDFFGNVLDKELARIWNLVDFAKLSQRKVKRYTGYCRGYRDSSRRAPSPLPVELRAVSSVQEEELLQQARDLTYSLWVDRIERRLKTT